MWKYNKLLILTPPCKIQGGVFSLWGRFQEVSLSLFNRLKSSTGFSLMELVLVVSLVAIMSFFAVPALMDTSTVNLEGVARKVEGDMRYAQTLATTTGQSHGFRTVAGEEGISGYEVYNSQTGQVVSSPYDHMPMTEDLEESYSNIAFGEVNDIRFDSTGSPTFVSGNGTVSLNSPEDSKNIEVNSTGLIRID